MRSALLFLFISIAAFANDITIDAAVGRRPISPYIFGKNNSLSDSKSNPTSQANWQKYRDAGIKMFRENGGNNSTKYNWRRKLSSHPDWYNNVYAHDWDYAATSLQNNMPEASGMWAFQLIGWSAANRDNNFNDWGYNNSQWWEGVHNNWAGGGGPGSGDGDPEKYLMSWPPDSTVGILTQWFDVLGLEKPQFRYWNMDNEPEIWNGTHDDVMPQQPDAEAFMQSYFAVAKKARALFPEIKLVGAVPANEWQWYNWKNDAISYKGKRYVWLEYFIMRVAEEQAASGVRLLDVVDLHFYPGESSVSDVLNLHRVWFDEDYVYPGANGVKRIGGGWNDGMRKEYIFRRCLGWLEKYIGADHGVGLGVTEMDIKSENPNVTAVWYASTLGVFADEDVELFTPWSWKVGMWEVLHLCSNYMRQTRISSSTRAADIVNAYASINTAGDSLTAILVNRDTAPQTITLNLANFKLADGAVKVLQLSDLPSSETFKSHFDNALKEDVVAVTSGSCSLTLPKLSVTAVLFTGETVDTQVTGNRTPSSFRLTAHPNPFNSSTTISYSLPEAPVRVNVYDSLGRLVRSLRTEQQEAGSHSLQLDGADLASGVYLVQVSTPFSVASIKILLMK
ncbi:T9SS C-terminal target domain-containing protein [candidate division KSB1 bacterium]|nr:MAG: T9SS C-terminal target domain-containing protein [candidate division KSB1 bacterium]